MDPDNFDQREDDKEKGLKGEKKKEREKKGNKEKEWKKRSKQMQNKQEE